VIRSAFAVALGALALAAAPASAHIQVRPTVAAPGDPVLFELIVPNEKDAKTVEVTLQVPKDVLPFSFEEPAGWTRTMKLNPDESIDTVTYKGKLAQDGFAQFSFLASTPEQEGEIVWKALQRYDDGSTVRWIGAPDSDNPAAVTKITKAAARENAGGEGANAAPTATATSSETSVSAQPAAAATTGDDGDSPLPLILSIAALVLAGAALVKVFR
jgi:uncharacterized protein YcnI